MSTDRKARLDDEYYLTTFGGGKDRGRCLQITGKTHYDKHPVTGEEIKVGDFIHLTKDTAKLMIKDLQDFIKDRLPED